MPRRSNATQGESCMLRRTAAPALAIVLATSLAGTAVASRAADPVGASSAAKAATHTRSGSAEQEPGSNAGPPYQFTTELMGEYSTMILKDQALLTRTDLGYRYWSGGQNNHIVVTLVEGGLKFRDTATKSFKKL